MKDIKKLITKRNTTILFSILSFVCVIGVLFYFYNCSRPYNMYERAFSQTTKEKRVVMKSTLKTSGDIEELSEKTINYSIDRDKKVILVSKEGDFDGESSELLICDKTLYLKLDENKYVKITDSSYLDKFTNDIKFEDDVVYAEFQKQIRQSIDKENITKSKIEKKIGDTDYKLTELTLVVPKDKAKEIISAYITQDFNENMEKVVDETIETQELSLKETGNQLSDKEKEQLKNEMITLLNNSLEEKIKNMSFSDITVKVGIDKKGYIRFREEIYDITVDGKKSTLKNYNEYIEFGKHVDTIDLKSMEIIEYSDYIEQEKEKNKLKTIQYTIENPNEEIDFEKINQIEDIEPVVESTEEKTQN